MISNASMVSTRIPEPSTMKAWQTVFFGRVQLLSTLLDGARRGGATAIQIDYDETAGVIRAFDDGSLASRPRTLFAVRDGMQKGPEELAELRSDLLRYVAMLTCARRFKVHTPAYAFALNSERFLSDSEILPAKVSSMHYG